MGLEPIEFLSVGIENSVTNKTKLNSQKNNWIGEIHCKTEMQFQSKSEYEKELEQLLLNSTQCLKGRGITCRRNELSRKICFRGCLAYS